MKLDPPIDSDTGAAGDQVIGSVVNDVQVKGETVIHAGERLHGRLLRFEQFILPDPMWMVVVRFDSLERAGVEQPIALSHVDEGVRTQLPPRFAGIRLPARSAPNIPHPAGSGLFVFYEAGRLTLGERFLSEWETK